MVAEGVITHIQYYPYDGIQSALADLNAGKIGLVVKLFPVISWLVKDHPDLAVAMQVPTHEQLGIAFAKNKRCTVRSREWRAGRNAQQRIRQAAGALVWPDALARGDDSLLHAFKLYTGPDNASHVMEGAIAEDASTDAASIHFKESPSHSAFDWHNAPCRQYVITLAGTLEFTTGEGEKFILHPGDVLLADDTAGTGHKWRLIDDQPWRRAYVVLKQGAKDTFVAKT
jgi:uncharacterized cupin superfamily protein